MKFYIIEVSLADKTGLVYYCGNTFPRQYNSLMFTKMPEAAKYYTVLGHAMGGARKLATKYTEVSYASVVEIEVIARLTGGVVREKREDVKGTQSNYVVDYRVPPVPSSLKVIEAMKNARIVCLPQK